MGLFWEWVARCCSINSTHLNAALCTYTIKWTPTNTAQFELYFEDGTVSVSAAAAGCRFGRKTSLILSVVIKSAGTVISIWANDYVTFVVGRFVCGYGVCGCFLTAFVLGQFTSSAKWNAKLARSAKLAFHDADTDTDTDIIADILARIVTGMSACRSACHRNNFRKSRVSDVSATILARMFVSVSVSVSASWNVSLKRQLSFLQRYVASRRNGHFFTNRIINFWNSLPDHIVLFPTVACFKHKLSNFHFNQ